MNGHTPGKFYISPPFSNDIPIRTVLAVSRGGAVCAHINWAFPEDAQEIAKALECHTELVTFLREIADKDTDSVEWCRDRALVLLDKVQS